MGLGIYSMFETALALFEEKAKKHPSIPRTFIDSVVLVLRRMNDDQAVKPIEIISKKFVFDTEFMQYYVNLIDTNKSTDTNYYYKSFPKLKRQKIIHKKSTDFYPNKLRLYSINPNPSSLVFEDFSSIDKYIDNKNSFLNHIDPMRAKYGEAGILCIYLHYFHFPALTKKDISSLAKSYYSVIDSKRVCLFYPKHSPMLLSGGENPFYQSVLFDEIASKIFLQNVDVFKNLNTILFREILESFHKDGLGDMSTYSISAARKNLFLFTHTPVEYSIHNKSLHPPMLCFNEIKALFPACIENGINAAESKLIDKAIVKASTLDEQYEDDDFLEDDTETWWSYADMAAFKELLKPQKSLDKTILENAFNELEIYIHNANNSGDVHSKMIFEFLLYLIGRLQGKGKIKHKTFKNYFSSLRIHLFNKVKNLADPKNYEIQKIIRHLEKNEYKKKSIFKIRYLIRRFYRFHSHHGINIDISLSSYSKSLVFNFEIDPILEAIEEHFYSKITFEREGKWIKFQLLQQKVIVLLAFYTGMRKKEVLSRLWKDFMIFDNEIIVDVNNEGMKPLGWNLKTRNAKRKISVYITNLHHLNLIKKWYGLRSSTLKNGYLFVSQKSNGHPKTKEAISETVIEIFNTIIAQNTKRYCTFHSLRHSFATYSFLKIIQNQQNFPYAIIDLAVKLGHETPETTINTYVHYHVLQLLKMDSCVSE